MATSKRFVCIHGHFYQPPRENPWLETVETQDSAAPYHDWNERICAECYATNGAARVVNVKNKITRIVNNYARISFNFGPTLLSWLKENAPRTYRMILDGERRSRKNFKGHSSAMAQVYNHAIMPLANRRDKITQIRWGIADYQHHYGIAPEGMWLAETAADTETLDLLAQHGIRFTVLAPHQCKRIRALSNDGEAPRWIDTPHASVDTTHPYLIRFESGASMADLLLRWADLARHCFRRAAELGRELRQSPQKLLPRRCARRAGSRGYGRRVVRSSSQARRDGPCLYAAADGAGQDRQAGQLRQLPRPVPARVRVRDQRQHFVELCARRGAMAV